MTLPFRTTLESLAHDSPRGTALAVLSAASLLAVWCGWLFLGRVSVYAVTDAARIEVRLAPHPVEATVDGRLAAVHVHLRSQVHVGEVIAELDREPERLEQRKAEVRLERLSHELAAVRSAIEVTTQGIDRAREASRDALRVASAERAQADAAAELAVLEADAAEALMKTGHLSQLERAESESAARQQRSLAEARTLQIDLLRSAERSGATDRTTKVTDLHREEVHLEGAIAETRAEIAQLDDAIARRLIFAPISGEIGELGTAQVGSFVTEGERIATVVPTATTVDDLRIVAEYEPRDALGRIEPGQTAMMRCDGFPWLQYGSLQARVERVGNEIREGRIRTELSLGPITTVSIPLQHGLPGSIRIRVEEVSPWTLLIRAVSEIVTQKSK